MSPAPTRLKHCSLAVALAFAVWPSAMTLAQPVSATHETVTRPSPLYQFDIRATPLPQAIAELSAITGLQVLYTEKSTFDHMAPALQGRYTASDALARLLAGSGLIARATGENSVTIEKSAVPSLSSVRVKGDGVETEHTGLYGSDIGTTALPFNASLRHTPQSVSIISSRQMEDQGIERLTDLIDQSIGLSINRYESNRGTMYARGFKIENYLIDGVPTNINEQWSAGEIFNDTVLYDRIEVLRGSDGLMSGFGNPSAVVNMVRKRASSREFTGSLSLRGGSWNQRGGTVDLSTPLSSTGDTRARLIADYKQGDSYIDRMKNRSQTFYGTVEQDIGEHTLLSAGISYQDTHTDNPTWGGLPAWYATSATDAWRTEWSRSKNVAPDWTQWDTDYTNWFIKAEHELSPDWRIRTSYSRGERNSSSVLALLYPYAINPATGTSSMFLEIMPGFSFEIPMAGYAGSYWVKNVKQDAALQLDGSFKLLGRTHELALGFEHSREYLKTQGAPADMSFAKYPYQDVRDLDGSGPTPPFPSKGTFIDEQATQQSIYAATRLSLHDRLRLILGMRHIDYRVDSDKDPTINFQFKNRTIPYGGLVLDLTPQISAYASYTDIFQPHTGARAANKSLDPMEGKTYEYGLKGEFFNGRLNASASAFRMQQDNVAKYDHFDPVQGQAIYRGVDGVTTRGFEIEVTGEIMPDWNISAGYTQFTAETMDDEEYDPLIPRKQFKLFTSYRLPGRLHGLTLGGGVRWQSSTHAPTPALAPNLPILKQKAYSVVDLMARYEFNDQWSAQLNVNNVFDRHYFSPTEDSMQIFWQEPRNFHLSMKYRF